MDFEIVNFQSFAFAMTTYSLMYDLFVSYHFIHITEISIILGLSYDFVLRKQFKYLVSEYINYTSNEPIIIINQLPNLSIDNIHGKASKSIQQNMHSHSNL